MNQRSAKSVASARDLHPTSDAFVLDRLPAEQQEQIADLLDQYLAAVERGESPQVENYLQAHPELAPILGEYFRSLGILQRVHAPLRQAELVPGDQAALRRIGDYQLVREIGRGGMGIVYEAWQFSLRRRVALKVLPSIATFDAKQLARFHREAHSAATLHHPHIVPVYAVGQEDDTHYYSMLLIEGASLDVLIRQQIANDPSTCSQNANKVASSPSLAPTRSSPAEWSSERCSARYELESVSPQASSLVPQSPDAPTPNLGRDLTQGRVSGSSLPGLLPWSMQESIDDPHYIRRVVEWGMAAAHALQHAHEWGVIHRDIKPSNLLLDRQGHLWITDFGLARVQAEESVTLTGDIVGTWRYMSPEQASGRVAVDARTDIYSLGATLYELLTLQPAVEGADRPAILRQIEECDPRPARKCNHAIPLDVQTILHKAMAKDVRDRYATAADLAEDLRRFLHGLPIAAQRPTISDLAIKWVARHRHVAAVSVAVWGLFAILACITAVVIARKNVTIAQQYRLARATVDQEVEFADQLAGIPGAEPIARDALLRALDYYRQVVAQSPQMQPDDLDLATAYVRIAKIQERFGNFSEAQEAYQAALHSIQLLDDWESSVDRQVQAALAANNLGLLAARLGQNEDARKNYQQAWTILAAAEDRFGRDATLDHQLKKHRALVLGNRGSLARDTGDLAEARTLFDQAASLREAVLNRVPTDLANRRDLATVYHNLSVMLGDTDITAAEASCARTIAMREALVDEYPEFEGARADLALSYNNYGTILARQKRLTEAVHAYEQAVSFGEALCKQQPGVLAYQLDLAVSYNNLGQTIGTTGDWRAATSALSNAVEILEPLAALHTNDASIKSSLGGTLHNLAILHERQGQLQDAIRLVEQACQQQTQAVQLAPEQTRYAEFLTRSQTVRTRLNDALRPTQSNDVVEKGS